MNGLRQEIGLHVILFVLLLLVTLTYWLFTTGVIAAIELP